MPDNRQLTGKRNYKVANLSFIAACMVVLIHCGTPQSQSGVCWWFNRFVQDGVCRMAVLYFFLIAGFFLAKECREGDWYWRALKKRALSLRVPFFALNLLALAVTHDGFWAGLGFNLCEYPASNSLWFLRTLFIYSCASVLLFPLIKCCRGGGQGVICVAIMAYLLTCTGYDVFSVTVRFDGLSCFLMGAALQFYRHELPTVGRSKAFLMIVASLGLLGVRVAAPFPAAARAGIVFVASMLLMAGLYAIVPSSLWPLVATCSFPIYVLHGFVMGAILKIGVLFVSDSIWTYAIRFVVAVPLCIVGSCFLRRFFPKLSGLVFGGR